MQTAFYGRIVFGASAVLFGVIALMWHDSDTWQNLQQIWRLPFGTLIGGCLMAALIAGAIGMQYPRTARLASVVLCVVCLCFSLACIPDIIAASNIYVPRLIAHPKAHFNWSECVLTFLVTGAAWVVADLKSS